LDADLFLFPHLRDSGIGALVASAAVVPVVAIAAEAALDLLQDEFPASCAGSEVFAGRVAVLWGAPSGES
jgi:hypothetical protein